jgi:hypothetical protein
MYMLFELTPDKSLTGGKWYDDSGEFEEDFTQSLATLCEHMTSCTFPD